MSEQPDIRLCRRRFLAMGSATSLLALASDALGARFTPSRTIPATGLEYNPLSVGYCPFVERSTPFSGDGANNASDRKVFAASGLPAGDPKFLETGAMVTIHGFVESESPRFSPRVSSLYAHVPFQIPDQGRITSVDYLAWQYETSPVRNVSSPVRLNVPVERGGGLQLTLQVDHAERGLLQRVRDVLVLGKSATSLTTQDYELRLTVGRDSSQSKLRPGMYFIAIGQSSDASRPVWHRWRLLSGAGPNSASEGYLSQAWATGSEGASFDYLLLSVDYASGLSNMPADGGDAQG